jgi:hypothetical protein
LEEANARRVQTNQSNRRQAKTRQGEENKEGLHLERLNALETLRVKFDQRSSDRLSWPLIDQKTTGKSLIPSG